MKRLSYWLICLTLSTFSSSCKEEQIMENASEQEDDLSSSRNSGISQHQIALNSAVEVVQGAINGEYTFVGAKAIETSTSIATLAVELVNGSTDPIYLTTYVTAIKKILNEPGKNQLIVTGNLQHREGSGVYFGMALGWNTPSLKSQFTDDEQKKIVLTMKAALVACAYVMADYTVDGVARPNKRIDMRGGVLFNSPNYAEGYAGSFLAATMVIGKDNIANFLNTYDHASFVNELKEAGLTTISTVFEKTFNVVADRIPYDALTIAKKEILINNYVTSIDNNEMLGKVFFKGVSLTNYIADPINLLAQLNAECFAKTAEEGDYIGQQGMATEFNTSDANGVRDALYYSASGVFNDVYSRYLVENYGYWATSTQASVKATIDQNLKVGLSDINSKAWNGYLSRRLGAYSMERLVPYRTGESWWQRVHDLAHNMGIAKEYYFNDSFQDADYTAFPAWTAISGSWAFASVTSFTGYMPALSTAVKDTVIKTNISDIDSRLMSDYSTNNYDVTVQCKVNTFDNEGQIGIIGRYRDANNYYMIKFNKATSNCTIIEVKKNVSTIVKTSPIITFDAGTMYILRASFDKKTIKFYINNVEQISVDDAKQHKGTFGLFTSKTDAYFDDVYVNKPTF